MLFETNFKWKRVLLAGPSTNPDEWVERIQHTWESFQKKIINNRTKDHLDMFWIGTWIVPDHNEMVIRTTMNSLMEVRSCA